MALPLSGCGGGKATSSASEPSAPATTLSISSSKPLAFDQKVYRARAGRVQITLANHSSAVHIASIEQGKTCCVQPGSRYLGGTTTASPGESTGGEATLTPGTYSLYCNVDSHWQQGMVSRLIVR